MKATHKNTTAPFPGLWPYGRKLYLVGKGYWAGWMETKTSCLSRKQLYGILAVFLCLSSGYCVHLIYSGISRESNDSIKMGRLKNVLLGVPASKHLPVTINDDYQKIKAFRNYLDSLSGSKSGRETRDSIMLARPGLLDSVAHLEAYLNRN